MRLKKEVFGNIFIMREKEYVLKRLIRPENGKNQVTRGVWKESKGKLIEILIVRKRNKVYSIILLAYINFIILR